MKYLNSADEDSYALKLSTPGWKRDWNANLKYSNLTRTQISRCGIRQVISPESGKGEGRLLHIWTTEWCWYTSDTTPGLSVTIPLKRLNCASNKSKSSALTAAFVFRIADCHLPSEYINNRSLDATKKCFKNESREIGKVSQFAYLSPLC